MTERETVEKFFGHWRVVVDLGDRQRCDLTRECLLCGFRIIHGGRLDRAFEEVNAEMRRVSAEVERHDGTCHPGEELWAQRNFEFRGALQQAMPAVLDERVSISYGLQALEWPDTVGTW